MADNGESGMNYDNIFIRMLSRVGDAMLLSILFVLSCVPIITIGAAFTSLYYTAMKGISGDDGYIWKFYTRSFKQNFKQIYAAIENKDSAARDFATFEAGLREMTLCDKIVQSARERRWVKVEE